MPRLAQRGLLAFTLRKRWLSTSAPGKESKKMNSYEIIEGTVEELIAEFCEETLRSARDSHEADTAAANFLTGILHQAEPLSRTWH
jgi:hypothetical protein